MPFALDVFFLSKSVLFFFFFFFAPCTLSKKDQCVSSSLSPSTLTSPVFQEWTNALVTCEPLLKVFILHHFNISVAFLKFPFRLLLYLCWVQNTNTQLSILDGDFKAIGLLRVSLLSVCFYYFSKSVVFLCLILEHLDFLFLFSNEKEEKTTSEYIVLRKVCHLMALELYIAWFGAELNRAAFISHSLLSWWV